MRLFVAVTLPQTIKEQLGAIIDEGKKLPLKTTWVHPDNLHLTMKFLGEVSNNLLASLEKALTEAAQRQVVFEANVTTFGFFPNERRARIFFVGTNQTQRFHSLHDAIETALAPVGFTQEKQFHAHITLARFKTPPDTETVTKHFEGIALEESFPVKELALVKSTLTRSGPQYQRLITISLAT